MGQDKIAQLLKEIIDRQEEISNPRSRKANRKSKFLVTPAESKWRHAGARLTKVGTDLIRRTTSTSLFKTT